ncbi:MAG: Z1 domain-containing protein [Thermodesulfobacteriota bacterium]|nr:Z1 domain-containing protein [Thermodesulfobacteriota bacterium]
MNTFDQIVQLSYAYFANKKVTPEEIRNFISRMIIAFPEEQIDEAKLFSKIESIHTVTIDGSFLTLEDSEGHEEWFNVSTNMSINREFQWHFWDHLKTYLINYKGRTASIVESLDRFTSEIISRLEDPSREGTWDRRGMVMGSVQSGKTLNYTALICKALDAGYKFIVVLTGIHNSLRSQTQDRLNEELLGYDLDRIQRLTGQERRIGVRRIFSDHRIVNTLTSSSQNGDFSRAVAAQAGIIPSLTGDPIVLIMKKNVTILKNLVSWLNSLPGTIDIENRRVVPDIPLLLIDDECDFASVNTKQPERDENGIIEDWNPTETNKQIRTLLFGFQKSAYVGYTATPYANIFIHKDDYHPRYGDDLFPRHFIISLPQPTNYIGPDYLFGITGDSEQGIESIDPLPLIRYVRDHSGKIPDTHKKDLRVDDLPESMLDAIKCFLLVSAARRIRKEGVVHNSMLIHVTRFTAVQRQIRDLVEKELRKLIARIMSGSDSLSDLKRIWETDIVPTSLDMETRGFSEAVPPSWNEIKRELFNTAKMVKVKGINGEIGDILDYREADALTREKIQRGENVSWEDRGISVIAIGGDKLSRGLTLDGLTISYYLRASRMYDTLMQMGRWFGYREGYNDLCRIYTTEELAEWYRHIALANQELRNELEYMVAINSTPENYGLKARSHPGRLAVTSAGKSRNAEKLTISFSGKFPKTIVFDPRHLENNRRALQTLVQQIGRDCSRDIDPEKPRYHWEKVQAAPVLNFLRSYATQDVAKRVVDPARIADFIERQNKNDELVDWHVIIASNILHDAEHKYHLGKYTIGCVRRTPLEVLSDKISIGTLTSPADELLDLSTPEIERASEFDRSRGKQRSDRLPTSLAIRAVRPKTRGLILIYLPACKDIDNPKNNYGLTDQEVVGFAISFPFSDTAVPIEYWAGPVYMEEY